MGGAPVRTEHILLAMIRYGGGLGPDILDEFGVLADVRRDTLKRLGRPLHESSGQRNDRSRRRSE